jgi:hypothetical protein
LGKRHLKIFNISEVGLKRIKNQFQSNTLHTLNGKIIYEYRKPRFAFCYTELREQFERLGYRLGKPPVLIIHNRLGRKYIVSSIGLDNCIENNCLFFSAYYNQDEVPSKENQIYSIALLIELYAGLELHAELPKNLKNEYIHINNKLGFKR